MIYYAVDGIRKETIPQLFLIKTICRIFHLNGGMRMRIGFIGAGKVGFSLGRYFTDKGFEVTGYYSRSMDSAKEAAEFTGTNTFSSLAELVDSSDTIFITVSDGAIHSVWSQLKEIGISDRVICHCSGVLSSEVFSDITGYNCFGYSIHPLLAVSSKYNSYREFSNTLFTIEGHESRIEEMTSLIRKCGNKVVRINAGDKTKYHGAAVMASNLVLGLFETAVSELMCCGFDREDAIDALRPLMCGNVEHLRTQTVEESLTGPVERADSETIIKHLEVFEGENKEIYRLLSKKATEIAKRKNIGRDYQKVDEILNE